MDLRKSMREVAEGVIEHGSVAKKIEYRHLCALNRVTKVLHAATGAITQLQS